MEAPDEAAFDAFYMRSWGRLYGQAYVLTGDRETSEDLTQEALLRAWKRWSRITAYEDPEGWARRVLHNLCIESWRKVRTARSRTTHLVEAGPDMPVHHFQLAQAMRTLPGEQARALLLHDGLGMTVPETAAELGVPEGTVRSWLSRSRKIVAARLDDPDHEPTERR
ncbi:MAG: SigE family RNA polymerase sigma factor [Acidimicrobiales bacterium]|jgi:RNA polymerase sigma-70 factor (ECF subfamily)